MGLGTAVAWIERILRTLDRFQQGHTVLGFPVAVAKKYGDDQAGKHAALLAYYGFLSLFPLLLVFVTCSATRLPTTRNCNSRSSTRRSRSSPSWAPRSKTASPPALPPSPLLVARVTAALDERIGNALAVATYLLRERRDSRTVNDGEGR